ncbi:metalloprotease TldD [Candidatus Vallotiella sp. (ex Adelges kitamiensis)]|uniref:metalloprotease TldD n=1 Tax=Candidatus Vallotiella sp. (ex Adelges kitamiensis) TaxID=2864217 RepID=UPI001CE2FBD7|nr:metalloprotease TldD [Candidatus Vallotia sp. (ex Adelges kitamiensis)]
MNMIEPNLCHLSTAKDLLLTHYGLDESILLRTLNEIFFHRVDYADLYLQITRSETWSLEEGIVKSGSFSIDQGVGVRAIVGQHTAFAYYDDLSLQALAQAAQATRSIAQVGSGKAYARVAGVLHSNVGHNLYQPTDPLNSLDANAKVALLERIEKIAHSKDPRVTQVIASLSGEYDVILVARSDGALAADLRPLVRMSVTVIAEQNQRREMGTSGGGGRYDYAYFTEEVITNYVDSAVHAALVNLEALPAPAGTMTVVLGPGWPGVLLHEAIGHGLEGDFNRKGSSAFSGRIGERVAAHGVTVVDNGTLANRRGSLNIDDEGNLTQCTTLIEDGILTGYMQDTLNARLMKTKVTGNARRESYAALPMPRMTNTYMLGGNQDPDEIIASVNHGLYAVNFGGGQVDITNGKFVFSTSEAYMIENGKISYPVKGATLVGNGPESLKYISMIGNNMSLDTGVGVCGKEGQTVPVGVGQPTLRIDRITVGGTI